MNPFLNAGITIEGHAPDKIYVVINKLGTSVLNDPGMGKVWTHPNKKYADYVARESGGHAVTWAEAVRILGEKGAN